MRQMSWLAVFALCLLLFSVGCSEKRSVAPAGTAPEPASPAEPVDDTTTPVEEPMEAD